jgi:GT2 family glycosyltransferase
MPAPRRFELEDILIRPGTYFNPETEVLVVIDDAQEVDPDIFEEDAGEGWVLIGDDVPIDERARDELIERFEVRHHPGTTGAVAATEDDPDELDEIEPDQEEDDEY